MEYFPENLFIGRHFHEGMTTDSIDFGGRDLDNTRFEVCRGVTTEELRGGAHVAVIIVILDHLLTPTHRRRRCEHYIRH